MSLPLQAIAPDICAAPQLTPDAMATAVTVLLDPATARTSRRRPRSRPRRRLPACSTAICR